ncbi:NAD(P)/FAD-dependent oxidoreductase [Nocardioides lentus]|uniref:NAD(P)/FAD-dependent oxidoreductase n=1 Tax=Nocardioides lentus TaxID=338077 RepID=A0ABN2NYF6_9ACTN
MDTETEVVVVGAGLAGLRCARALREAGRDVVVCEAADTVGGRVATDVVDGHLADRGFQLLNPAYPAVGRWVDADALGLQPFPAGVVAPDLAPGGTRLVLADPRREPGALPATLWGALGAGRAPRDAVALARWAAPLLRQTLADPLPDAVAARPPRRRGRSLASRLDPRTDRPLREALDAVGAAGELRRVLERFLAGVVLDDSGSTSSHYVLLLLRSFLTGRPSLPADGMRALPAQLAAPLGDRVLLGRRVEAVEDAPDGGVVVRAGGDSWRARAVVVAADPPAAAALTGAPVAPTRGVVTCWWSLDEAPTDSALLHVDGGARAAGPVVNTAVVSHAAPSYAPAGRHLVQASALLGPTGAPDRPEPSEPDVRRHAARLLGAPDGAEARWRLLARHVVEVALPAQPAPLSTRRPTAVPGRPGVHLAGDHRDTASIQGALVGGERAARAVLARLAGG